MKPLTRKILVLSTSILGALFAFWMVQPTSVWTVGTKDALCILDLHPGDPNVTVPFTTFKTLEQFFVVMRPKSRGELLSLIITGEDDFLCSVTLSKSTRFSFTPDKIPPGTYKAVLKQQAGNQGGRVVISDRHIGVTGWQILSRALVAFLVISGLWAAAARKSNNRRRHATSLLMFQSLLLACTLIFLYLLFHEGGHALGSSLFGRYNFNRSDFWGIHSSPHSAINASVQVKPWQRAIESFAGPMLPTFIGWALFLLWRSRPGRRIRYRRTMLNLYLSAIVAMLVLPSVVMPGYILGLITDGDWRGFIENVPAPLWLVNTLLSIVLLINTFILWRIVPELWRAYKTHKEKFEAMIQNSHRHCAERSDTAI